MDKQEYSMVIEEIHDKYFLLKNEVDKYIKDILLDYNNISKILDLSSISSEPTLEYASVIELIGDYVSYAQDVFDNEDKEEEDKLNMLFNFKNNIAKENYYQIMFSIIMPKALNYDTFRAFKACRNLTRYRWVENSNSNLLSEFTLLSLYSEYWAKYNLEYYQEFINDVSFNITARKIAIKKLKRNKIVKEGFLLKVSKMGKFSDEDIKKYKENFILECLEFFGTDSIPKLPFYNAFKEYIQTKEKEE